MLNTTVAESFIEYIFTITDGLENSFEYRWGKEPPEGQTIQEYLQNCKREAELLAQFEIDKKAPPRAIVL